MNLEKFKETVNKIKVLVEAQTEGMFVKKVDEINPEKEDKLFNKCLAVLCSCENLDQKITASGYLDLAAKQVFEDPLEREVWISGINEKAFLYITPKIRRAKR